MQVQLVLLLAWVAVPVVVFGVAGVVITWRGRKAPAAPPIEPAQRLEQLLEQRGDSQTATRGRMADAVRLAEDSAPARTLLPNHH